MLRRKFGEVREDGYIFRGYQKGANGPLEQWVSPQVFEQRKQATRDWQRQRMQDPTYRAKANARTAAWQKAARRKNPVAYMLSRAKSRAAALGVPFALSAADVCIPKRCPVFGLVLRIAEGAPDEASPELDRIRPELGYVPGNVMVLSRKANRMKQDASLKDLRRFARFYATFSPPSAPRKPAA